MRGRIGRRPWYFRGLPARALRAAKRCEGRVLLGNLFRDTSSDACLALLDWTLHRRT